MILNKIRAIELGWGKESIHFSTSISKQLDIYVDEIIEDKKHLESGYVTVYQGFKDGKPVFEMIAGHNITIYY